MDKLLFYLPHMDELLVFEANFQNNTSYVYNENIDLDLKIEPSKLEGHLKEEFDAEFIGEF